MEAKASERLGTPLTEQEAAVLARAVKTAVEDAWRLLYGFDAKVTMDSGDLVSNNKPGAHAVCFGYRGADGSMFGDRAWFGITVESQPDGTAQ